jgi:hypothetical protein
MYNVRKSNVWKSRTATISLSVLWIFATKKIIHVIRMIQALPTFPPTVTKPAPIILFPIFCLYVYCTRRAFWFLFIISLRHFCYSLKITITYSILYIKIWSSFILTYLGLWWGCRFVEQIRERGFATWPSKIADTRMRFTTPLQKHLPATNADPDVRSYENATAWMAFLRQRPPSSLE